MPTSTLIAIGVGAVLVLGLGFMLMRGRFSTPERRADLALQDMASSAGVPKKTTDRSEALSLGHSGDSTQIRGKGVLWLNDTTLGFALSKPVRQFEIPLKEVRSVVASNEFSRIGMTQSSPDVDFLVVNWNDPSGSIVMGFKLDGAESWAAKVGEAAKDRKRHS